jgi:YfiH family protein
MKGDGARTIREIAEPGSPVFVHPEWAASMPWLAQGVTGRTDGSVDMGLFGETPVGVAQTRWRELRDALGCPVAVHARQVHRADVLWHESLPAGLVVAWDADGHATATAGLLLAISVADCVPVQAVDPARRVIGAFHAGWRGTAAGILEAGLETMAAHGAQRQDIRLHFGPAICGACYEVGPEVPEALGLGRPEGKTQLDVRSVLVDRAAAAGIPASHITRSAWCTRCGDSPFFSHRAGQPERQMSVLGIRP